MTNMTMTNKLLLTLAAIAVVASTDAFAQKGGRPTEIKPGEVVDPTKSREEISRERAKRNTGLRAAGKSAAQSDVRALTEVITSQVKGEAAEKTHAQLDALMADSSQGGTTGSIGVLLKTIGDHIKDTAPTGTALNNAIATRNLIAELGRAGRLTVDGLQSSKVDLVKFLSMEALSIVGGAPSKSYVDTVVRMTEAVKAGKSIDDVLFEGITGAIEGDNAKKEEMEKFCKNCPGACK